MIDLVPFQNTDERHPLSALAPRPGGGPYNTAVALGRLGSPTAFLSRISTDAFGEALLDRLNASGVRTDLVQRGPEPTTLALAGIDSDGSARYSFYIEQTADRLFDDPGGLPAETAALSFGTLSLVLEPGASAYERLLIRAAASSTFTALDPNIRAALIPDADAYRQRFLGWLPHVSLLKLSLEDACWLAGRAQDADPTPHIKQWLDAGPQAIILTRGSAGLTAFTRGGGKVDVSGVKLAVVDTIGAGDTVNAALLHWLREHDALNPSKVAGLSPDQWHAALTFAARAAAITCSRAGAEPPFAAELTSS